VKKLLKEAITRMGKIAGLVFVAIAISLPFLGAAWLEAVVLGAIGGGLIMWG